MPVLSIVQLEDFKSVRMQDDFKLIDTSLFLNGNSSDMILGINMTLYPSNSIDHYVITEEIASHIFTHNIVKVRNEFFPISTKCVSNSFKIRKIYTNKIKELLAIIEGWGELLYDSLPIFPRHPFHSIEQFFVNSCLADEDRVVDEDLFTIYEHSKLNNNNPEHVKLHDKNNIGYIDHEIAVARLYNLFDSLQKLNDYKVPTYSNTKICQLIDSYYFNRLPFEEKLIIYNPKLEKVINNLGIYYPKESKQVYETKLSITEYPWRNLNLSNLLKFCDFYLPTDCTIVVEDDLVVKFEINDPYFDSITSNFRGNYHYSVDYNLEINEDHPISYYRVLSDLLGIIRYKTGIDPYNFPFVELKKFHDLFVVITLRDILGNYYQQGWDLSLIQLADPLQYLLSFNEN